MQTTELVLEGTTELVLKDLRPVAIRSIKNSIISFIHHLIRVF